MISRTLSSHCRKIIQCPSSSTPASMLMKNLHGYLKTFVRDVPARTCPFFKTTLKFGGAGGKSKTWLADCAANIYLQTFVRHLSRIYGFGTKSSVLLCRKRYSMDYLNVIVGHYCFAATFASFWDFRVHLSSHFLVCPACRLRAKLRG